MMSEMIIGAAVLSAALSAPAYAQAGDPALPGWLWDVVSVYDDGGITYDELAAVAAYLLGEGATTAGAIAGDPSWRHGDIFKLALAGDALNLAGMYEESLEYFDMILREDPDDPGALSDKGAALGYLGRHGEAIAYHDLALILDPGHLDALYNKGTALVWMERYEEAMTYYDQALAISPGDPDVLTGRGIAAEFLGRHDEAASYYDMALKADPWHVDALFSKGYVLSEMGMHDEALSYYDMVLERSPGYIDALYEKGRVLEAMGMGTEAGVYYGRVSEIDPAYMSLGQSDDLDHLVEQLAAGGVTYYVDPVSNYSTYDAGAFAEYLEEVDPGGNLVRTHDETSADILITWARDYGDGYLGMAYSGRVATIGLGSSDCWDWQEFDERTITETIWHEIGHIFGYGHSGDPDNIMHEHGYARLRQDLVLDEVLPFGYYMWRPLCGNGTQQISLEADGRFQAAVLKPGTDPEDFMVDFVGARYHECGRIHTMQRMLSTECDVDHGATLLVSSIENRPITVTGRVTDANVYPEVDPAWDPGAYEYDPWYLERINAAFGFG